MIIIMGVPLRREYGAILVLVRSCPRRFDLGARLACLRSHGPNQGLAQPATCVSFRILGQKPADGYAENGSPARFAASWCSHRRPAAPTTILTRCSWRRRSTEHLPAQDGRQLPATVASSRYALVIKWPIVTGLLLVRQRPGTTTDVVVTTVHDETGFRQPGRLVKACSTGSAGLSSLPGCSVVLVTCSAKATSFMW